VTLARRLTESLASLGVRLGDAVGVACSGGADSVALLHLLRRSPLAAGVTVLHVDHGLHEASASHAEFVAELASVWDMKCEVMRVKVKPGGSIEAAARDARYQALSDAASRHGLSFVATAHTLDDQTETVLMRLQRGGSLAAISPSLGVFIRPLLDVRRIALREWLSAEGLVWCEDPTNDDLRFERNWTRNVVLPLLRERRSGIDEVLARTAARAREDEEALDALAGDVLSRAQTDDVGILLTGLDLEAQPRAIRSRVVIAALRLLGADPSHTDIDAIIGGSTRHECGPVSVWSIDDGLAFIREPVAVPEPVLLDQNQSLGAWGIRVRKAMTTDTPPWRWRCRVPGDSSNMTIRSRRPGDRVLTAAGTKKVQDVLVDAKVPRPLRDLVPILATGDEALAVVGLTHRPQETATVINDGVIDVTPSTSSWSRGAVWNRN